MHTNVHVLSSFELPHRSDTLPALVDNVGQLLSALSKKVMQLQFPFAPNEQKSMDVLPTELLKENETLKSRCAELMQTLEATRNAMTSLQLQRDLQDSRQMLERSDSPASLTTNTNALEQLRRKLQESDSRIDQLTKTLSEQLAKHQEQLMSRDKIIQQLESDLMSVKSQAKKNAADVAEDSIQKYLEQTRSVHISIFMLDEILISRMRASTKVKLYYKHK